MNPLGWMIALTVSLVATTALADDLFGNEICYARLVRQKLDRSDYLCWIEDKTVCHCDPKKPQHATPVILPAVKTGGTNGGWNTHPANPGLDLDKAGDSFSFSPKDVSKDFSKAAKGKGQ